MLDFEKIVLRPLIHSDLQLLQKLENNKENWIFGSEEKEYTDKELLDYISKARTDITIAKQYRFVIEANESIGLIDLFDYNAASAFIGIIISKDYRNQGFGKQALKLLTNYAFNVLNLSKLYCIIKEDNFASIRLFTACGFKLYTQKKEFQYFVKLAEN